jgi:hypothetical protein
MKLTYLQKLQRAEAREFKRIKNKERTESNRQARAAKKQQSSYKYDLRKEQIARDRNIRVEARKLSSKKRRSSHKTKRMFKKAWRKLV